MVSSRALLVDVDVSERFGQGFEGYYQNQSVNSGNVDEEKRKKMGS